MPPRKAAKHARTKATKKHAARLDAEGSLKDTLRAYEHLGHVRILVPLLAPEAAVTVKLLGNLSKDSLTLNAPRDAAELLCAAEHYCFGALATKDAADSMVSEPLKRSIEQEYNHLRARADVRAADLPVPLKVIYEEMSDLASRALSTGVYRAALEMARGLEALSHVEGSSAAFAEAASTNHIERQ